MQCATLSAAEGYLVIQSTTGDLSGRTTGGGQFFSTFEEAEAAAKGLFRPEVTSHPVFVVKVTRFALNP